MKIIIYALIFTSILLSCNIVAAEPKFKKWTDEKGVIHIESINQQDVTFLIDTSNSNSSFEELKKEIEKIVSQRKNDPELKKYLNTLSYGMTPKEVQNRWGKTTIAGGYEEGTYPANKVYKESVSRRTYPIGITLYFKNNELIGWSTSINTNSRY